MAWNRVDIGTKLVMAVGENSPVICSGAPIYYKDASSDMQATPPHSYNVTGFYSGATKPDYDAISAIHGSGGIGLWSIVNNLTVNGDTLKIWNVNLGDTVCLEIRRQNSSTAQWRTVNHGDATGWRTLENFTQPSQGYGTMLEPCMNIGFFQNDDDNSIVLLTQRTYSNNANTTKAAGRCSSTPWMQRLPPARSWKAPPTTPCLNRSKTSNTPGGTTGPAPSPPRRSASPWSWYGKYSRNKPFDRHSFSPCPASTGHLFRSTSPQIGRAHV